MPLDGLLGVLIGMVRLNGDVSLRELAEAAGLDPAKDFRGTGLSNLDLRNEDLNGFNFSNADLSGSDLRGAKTENTHFTGADLKGVVGIKGERAKDGIPAQNSNVRLPEVNDFAGSTILELEQEIEISRRNLATLDRRASPDAWLLAVVRLANGLRTLGRLKGNPALAAEGADAFQEALSADMLSEVDRIVLTRGFANALRVQGGLEPGTSTLLQAEAKLREVILQAERLGLPLEVAKTQEHLGNTLKALGERNAGTAQLEEAVDAYRRALTDELREAMPNRWARIQSRLAVPLTRLGQRYRNPTLLHKALAALDEALVLQSPEVDSLEWGRTKSLQGDALSALGRMERKPRLIERAVSAYQEALTTRTRDVGPLEWGRTQSSLGVALSALGARRRGLNELEQGRSSYLVALSAQSQALAVRDRARTQLELARTLSLIGLRRKSLTDIQDAERLCRDAMALLSEGSFAAEMRRGYRIRATIKHRRQLFALKSNISVDSTSGV